ncbi:hypothetical protein IscW_ISCW020438 [Ixodes scapularis]|uniref:Uncharacterized protein n=1 Tax=Ixodes scapularis TaxID=6945 RepID=B7PZX9_IXOSC|nr:hypothetical protein IscW_ISCW020438 [Ixodes scapularis]|eukprot:XP_002406482.1 hypothetical protein IscW_ISCW020438 [Ixodes scapularis]
MEVPASSAHCPPQLGKCFAFLLGPENKRQEARRFPYHRARDEADSVAEPRHVDDPAEHPDAIRCFGARMARGTVFGTAAPGADRLRGSEMLESMPPSLPTLPSNDQVGSCGIQDLINVELDL